MSTTELSPRADRSPGVPTGEGAHGMLLWKTKSTFFEETAMPHLDAVYRFALHLCGNEIDAQDLTQDCFLQAYDRFHQFRRGSNCRAWLFRIARNAHIDRLRRSRREPRTNQGAGDVASRNTGSREQSRASHLEPAAPEPPTAPLSDPSRWERLSIDDEEIFLDMFGDEVQRMLGELPDEFRWAVVLCDVEGFTYREISEILGCPIGTIRSRIARARGQLRERLFQYARGLGYVQRESKR